MITYALARRTEDAQLDYHAGMIARATGDTTGAIAHLERALALNARFSPSQAPIAARVLDSLRTARPRELAVRVSASSQ